MDFKKIEDLINDEKYVDAEKELEVCISDINSSEKDISIANYLIGYIHTCWRNKEKVGWKGRRALHNCIDSSYPIPYAFYLYADIEEDKNVAINFLKKGLNIFPESSTIYKGLIKHSQKKEQLKIINEIKQKGFSNYDLLKTVIENLVTYELWDDVGILSCRLIENNDLDEYTKNYFLILSSYSKLLTKEEKKVLEALEGFELLVEQDVQNVLHYSHYLGAIACSILLNDNIKVMKYFDKLPTNNSIKDLNDSPECIIEVNFINIYKSIFNELSKLFLDDKERKQKCDCLKVLYLFNPYDMYNTVRFSRKNIKELKRFYRTNANNVDIGSSIFKMECEFKMYFDAYTTYMQMLNNYLNPKDADFSILIDNCSEEEFEKFFIDVCEKIDNEFDISMSLLVEEVIDSIISRLWESKEDNKKYKRIIEISEKINIFYLKESYKLFEIAYSYAKFKNPRAIELYEILLEKEPRNSSALNNLGAIYEDSGDLIKSRDYYSKAFKINNTEDLYSRNFKRVEARLVKYMAAFEKVKNESIWFIGRISMFYSMANEAGEIQCSYKNRCDILKVGPEKANELVDKMIKNSYIEKISNGGYNTTSQYSINPQIKAYLKEKESRMEINREYEKMAEKLNIDYFEDIGYTSELVELLNNIEEIDFREILKRDLKECVVLVSTGQNKSSIIMCGSIIEALLMNKIIRKGIEKYDISELIKKTSKMKKVIEMDLNELLFVADKESLVKKEHYHLSQFARSYRNIIHPACEIRKGVEISNENAMFIWRILIRIMKEVLPN